MKRIALLGFIVFVVPVWIVSCHKCGSMGHWVWTKAEIAGTHGMNGLPVSAGDTVKTDSVYFSLQFSSVFLGINSDRGTSVFSAIACDPGQKDQKNRIVKMSFGIGSLSFMDTSIMSSLVLINSKRSYEWINSKESFITEMSDRYANQRAGREIGKFRNPHNSKAVQIEMMAIRENGDTLKAVSEEIFLK